MELNFETLWHEVACQTCDLWKTGFFITYLGSTSRKYRTRLHDCESVVQEPGISQHSKETLDIHFYPEGQVWEEWKR